jgi:hypothetical protein
MDKSICLSVCSGGSIKTDTVSCLMASMAHFPVPIHMIMPVGGYVAQNRTMSVRMAMEHGSTHIMFIDSDMTFPPDGMERLFKQNKRIIGANYNARQLPLVSTVKLFDKNGNFTKGSAKNFPKKTFKVAAVGTGFCLIDLKVFDEIDLPWFWAGFEGDEMFKTEDVYFCLKAKKFGIDTWCDPTIEVLHLGDYRY